jgi:RNA polymerase sigma factor FliA
LATELKATDSIRDALILEHMPLVRKIAARIARGVPLCCVKLDDLVSAGTVGLIEALDRYDPNRDARLRTYAGYRIQGAILDSLRRLDWASKQRRKLAKDIYRTIDCLMQKLMRAPKEDEIARELGVTLGEYHARLLEIEGIDPKSLETFVCPGTGKCPADYLSGGDSPHDLAERAECLDLLLRAFDALPTREKRIFDLERRGLTLRGIAAILGISLTAVLKHRESTLARFREALGLPEEPAVRARRAAA